MKELTTPEAALVYRLSACWVRRLAAAGRVKGRKVGRDWVLHPASLERYLAGRRPVGRPPRKEAVDGR